MSGQVNATELTLAGVAHRCAQETELFFQHQAYDPRYCFELFRRAILERDPRAWQHVYTQYWPLVMSWVDRHPSFAATGEEAQYFVNRAFEKMWLAVTPDRFACFPDLKSLLRYLQMCVHSVVLDQARAAWPLPMEVEAEGLPSQGCESGLAVENQALAQVQRRELWEQISRRLHNDKERRVLYGSFVLALKPRELCAKFPGTFRDVDEVYSVKQNVLDRLRRDAELMRFLG